MHGRRLSGYLKKYRLKLCLILILAGAGTACTVAGPQILGNVTTEVFQGIMAKLNGTGGMDFGVIARILLLLFGLYLAGTCFTFLAGWMMAGISERLTCELRNAASEKLHVLPIRYYETKTAGEILTRVTADIDTFGKHIGQSVYPLLNAAAMILGIVFMMLRISVPLTAFAAAVFPASVLVLRLLSPKAGNYLKTEQEAFGKMSSQVEEIYSSHTVVRVLGGEKEAFGQFCKESEALYEASWRAGCYSEAMMLLTQLAGNLGYVLTALFGGWFAFSGAMQVGDIQAFIHYIRNISQPVQQISQAAGMLQAASAAWERIDAFLGEPEEEADSGIEKEEQSFGERGLVRFAHVSFGYSERHMVLKEFNAEIRPGQQAAIVGRTGAGKTTLMKLLLRFYDVEKGAVYVDGRDVREYDRSRLRKKFAVVMQDTWLFHGTVMDNIRYGRPGATAGEVQAAAAAASADAFIRQLPQGYETVIDEETASLSKGQKQLLTIARAILMDPEILILDEATSSVDAETERQVQYAMEKLMKGRTCLIIAHRLSTIRSADLILKIEEGR